MYANQKLASLQGREIGTVTAGVGNAIPTSTRKSRQFAGGRIAGKPKHRAIFHEDHERRKHGFDQTTSPHWYPNIKDMRRWVHKKYMKKQSLYTCPTPKRYVEDELLTGSFSGSAPIFRKCDTCPWQYYGVP